MIVLDTSVLIDSFSGSRRSASALREAIEQGERMLVPALVLYEWLRGPRTPEQVGVQEALFPGESAVVFGWREAELSAKLYRSVRRARTRDRPAIAACAIIRDAALWTLNPDDFSDIPQLRLFGR